MGTSRRQVRMRWRKIKYIYFFNFKFLFEKSVECDIYISPSPPPTHFFKEQAYIPIVVIFDFLFTLTINIPIVSLRSVCFYHKWNVAFYLPFNILWHKSLNGEHFIFKSIFLTFWKKFIRRLTQFINTL